MLNFHTCHDFEVIFIFVSLKSRTDDGGDEAESGAGKRTVGGGGEEADGVGETAGSGRDQKETVVR